MSKDRAKFNQLVVKIVEDTNLLLNVSQKMSSECQGHQGMKDTSDDSSDDSADDDVVNYNGKKYHYHPPELEERVQLLWDWDDGNTHWSVGTIISIGGTAKKKKYTIKYESGEVREDYLRIKDFPAKWRFVDN